MYKPCSKFVGKFDAKKAVFLCNDGLGHPGQFVYIRDEREEQEYFGLCEVEVFQLKSKFFFFAVQGSISPTIQGGLSIFVQRSFGQGTLNRGDVGT